jgi:hypothetical protein
VASAKHSGRRQLQRRHAPSNPPPRKTGKLADHHEEDLLRQIIRLATQTRHAPEPPLDQRQVETLQALPVGGLRPGHPEAIEQADGCQVHKTESRTDPRNRTPVLDYTGL